MDNLRERFTPFLQDVFNVMKEGVLIIVICSLYERQ